MASLPRSYRNLEEFIFEYLLVETVPVIRSEDRSLLAEHIDLLADPAASFRDGIDAWASAHSLKAVWISDEQCELVPAGDWLDARDRARLRPVEEEGQRFRPPPVPFSNDYGLPRIPRRENSPEL